ncbi:UDP-N-acetylmuramyl-tripeptide synthetase [Halobacillus sp. ACCC02827]|uniref:Mur ligase family protein n=1 Tax=Bacillaceae TaxID=186817 RepID=UPI0002A4FAD9|nr:MULTISPECIES: UDP-N-acetylmuramyl-tripeptide synthetase [Bacillaceae]ELK48226.1 UDP-N-acetylmuramyl tripeptide synthetase [Halobacillus sp. BAB-2008]QHT48401.1 UDP-N-acetylmuramyl-tripeptide synthetase [Bacillus sp. SB49]WJE15634.1 UDP-N-acetylmuramyl-tripeptide synthetase [Halobacillus sp. ACCC02827]
MAKLKELLSSIHIVAAWNDRDMDVQGLAYNSRNVTPGDVFVCIKGFKTDGHVYIADALANGAAAIVVEDYQEGWDDLPQYQVTDSRKALAALSDAFYGHPSRAMKTIGITATNGKTSTSFMTDAILEEHGWKTGLIGTVVVKFGDYSEPTKLTTPESLDLHHYFAQMRDQDVSHVTMEVSSSALDLSRVGSVDFDIVSLNNISREHIDLHGSFEEYFNSKASLIRNAGAGKWAILNLDDAYSASLIEETEANVLTFSVETGDGDLICKNLDLSTGRAKFTVEIRKPFTVGGSKYGGESFDIELSTPGYHSVYNSMVAIAAALLNEIPIETIQKGLKGFGGVERRFEMVFEDDFKILDDHFANYGNINVTLSTLEQMDYADLKLVYAIRGSRGVTVNRENAQAIMEWAPKLGLTELIATVSHSHVTEKDVVTEEEVRVFQEMMDKAGIRVHLYKELDDAVQHALSEVKENDVVLLAGCQGMDPGAKIALEQLNKTRPEMDEDILFKPLKNRVAGIS